MHQGPAFTADGPARPESAGQLEVDEYVRLHLDDTSVRAGMRIRSGAYKETEKVTYDDDELTAAALRAWARHHDV
jgi:hypothetical protein